MKRQRKRVARKIITASRRLSKARYASFLALCAALMKDMHGRQTSPAEVERLLASALDGKTSSGLHLLYEDEVAVALILYTGCTGFGGDWVILHELYVIPARRGEGLALELTSWFYEWAGRAGYRYAFATTQSGNAVVLHIAKRVGLAQEPLVGLERHYPTDG